MAVNQTPAFGGVSPVSPGEFASNLSSLIERANAALSGIIVPLASLSLLASCLVFVLGAFLGWGAVRRIGLAGALCSVFGLALFWAVPLVIAATKVLVTGLVSK